MRGKRKLVELKESDIDDVERMLNNGDPTNVISAELDINPATVASLKREYLDRIHKQGREQVIQMVRDKIKKG